MLIKPSIVVLDRYNPINKGLMNFWPLDGRASNTNTAEPDIVGSSSSVSLTKYANPIYANGKYGKTLSFTKASSQYLQAIAPSTYTTTSLGSIVCVVGQMGFTDNTVFPFTAYSTTTINSYLWIAPSNTGSAKFEILHQNDGGTINSVIGTTTLSCGVYGLYYVLIVTANGTIWTAYINGIKETLSVVSGSNTGKWFSNITGLNKIGIGCEGRHVLSHYSTMSMVSVLVYDRVLNNAEIALLSTNPWAGTVCPSLTIGNIPTKKHQDDPSIAPVTEVYTSAQTVTLTSAEADAIYYTTDGTTPDITKTLYTAPFILAANTKVQAIAIKGSRYNSNVSVDILAITDSTGPVYDDTTITAAQYGDGIKVHTPAGISAYHSPVSYKIYARKGADPTVSDTYLVAQSNELTIYFDRDADNALLTDGSWHVLAVCIDAVGNVTAGTHIKTVAYIRATVAIPDLVTNFQIDALVPGRVTGFAAA